VAGDEATVPAITVLGCTISMISGNRDRATTVERTARIVRSVSVNCGRLIWRWSTMI
jgi:hypothetical protein